MDSLNQVHTYDKGTMGLYIKGYLEKAPDIYSLYSMYGLG